MAYLILPSKRTRQPSGPVRVTAEWLSRGLVASFTPSAGFVDLARNNNASGIVGNITNAVGSQGRAWAGAYQGSNNYVLIPRTNDLAYTSGVTFEALITVNAFQTNVFPYISGVISQAHEPTGGVYYYGPVLRFNSTGSVGNAAQPVFFVSQSGVEKQATGAAQSTNVPIHLIGLYNGANSVLWVNGVKTVGAAVTGSIDNNVNNFITLFSDFVGAPNDHNRCLNGNLYFANIYNRGLTDAEALDRYLFRWGHLRPDPSRIYFGAGSGTTDVTVALTGSAVTSNAGTAVANVAQALSGSAVTTSAGTVTPVAGVTVALSGSAVTATAGTLSVAISNALSGSAVTTSAGTVTPSTGTFVALSGAAVTTSAGTLSVAVSCALSGSAVTASAGTVTNPGQSIWTDVGVSAATWADVGGATSIWTDL